AAPAQPARDRLDRGHGAERLELRERLQRERPIVCFRERERRLVGAAEPAPARRRLRPLAGEREPVGPPELDDRELVAQARLPPPVRKLADEPRRPAIPGARERRARELLDGLDLAHQPGGLRAGGGDRRRLDELARRAGEA